MTHVVVIGCGVVGAMIAYELSQLPEVSITVVDRQPPAQAATGAALGVLMGVISQKTKGMAWSMRDRSVRRYETLIPELEAQVGYPLPFNRQGIVKLSFEGEDLSKWEALIEMRHRQGWHLEIWHPARLQAHCPQVNSDSVRAAIYSPQDRQVDPTALTLALVKAAQQKGVAFQFGCEVKSLDRSSTSPTCQQVQTTAGAIAADWVVVAAGLGSTALTQTLDRPIAIGPVLGQALQLRLTHPLGHPDFQPIITGSDIHIVPIVPTAAAEYWVGATVEFPVEASEVTPDPTQLQTVLEGAIALCPALKTAEVVRTWQGLRPRPQGRPAPIVEPLSGYGNVLLATGHYRNGVLLAPATAELVVSAIRDRLS